MNASAVRSGGVKPILAASTTGKMNVLLSRLDKRQRSWYLAVEPEPLGHAAERIQYEITGVKERPFVVDAKSWLVRVDLAGRRSGPQAPRAQRCGFHPNREREKC